VPQPRYSHGACVRYSSVRPPRSHTSQRRSAPGVEPEGRSEPVPSSSRWATSTCLTALLLPPPPPPPPLPPAHGSAQRGERSLSRTVAQLTRSQKRVRPHLAWVRVGGRVRVRLGIGLGGEAAQREDVHSRAQLAW
jgi:hypothetical protein